MFDLGFQELVIIFVVALLVFGPKKLPEIGRSLGRGIAELKKAMQGIQSSIHEEEKLIKKDLPDIKESIEKPLASINLKVDDLQPMDKANTPGNPDILKKSEKPESSNVVGQTSQSEDTDRKKVVEK